VPIHDATLAHNFKFIQDLRVAPTNRPATHDHGMSAHLVAKSRSVGSIHRPGTITTSAHGQPLNDEFHATQYPEMFENKTSWPTSR
jgi:hypothetical protein